MQVLEPSKASFLFLFCALTSVGFTLQEKAMFSSKKNGFFKWAWVFGAIWLLDILWVPGRVIHPVSNPYADPAVAQGSAKIKQLAREGRVVSLRPEDYTPPDVSDLTDFFRQKIQTLTPNTNVVQGIRSVGGYLSIYVDGFQNILKYLKWRFPYDGRVLDAAGGRLFVLPQPLRAFKYQVAEREGLSVLTTNAGAMGNAWEVENIREFPDRAHVFEALLDPKAFLENELYTEKSPGGGAVRLEPDVHDSRGVGSVGWWDRWSGFWQRMWGSAQAIKDSRPSPCRADFDVNFEKKGFLVFDEAFCPGWHSWVDGRPQTIFRAYGFWMAVMVPEEGVHQITFRYEPVSFRLGLFLSLLTSVALGVGFYLKRRQLLENLLVPFLKI
jgi:hypothetical protein